MTIWPVITIANYHLARGVAKNEDAPLIKWVSDTKTKESGVGCYQYGEYSVYIKRQEAVIIAIYKSEGSNAPGDISEGN